MLKISHENTFYFLRYAHVRQVKSLFTNIQKRQNMLKISLLFKKFTNYEQITREFLGLRMRNFQGIVFLRTQTFRETLESALVYSKCCLMIYKKSVAILAQGSKKESVQINVSLSLSDMPRYAHTCTKLQEGLECWILQVVAYLDPY